MLTMIVFVYCRQGSDASVMHDVSVIVVCCIAARFDNNNMLNLFLQSREIGK